MELKITLSGERIQLPLAYSRIIQGFFYNALSDDLLFSDKLHEFGYSFKQRKFKLFSFGEPQGKYEVTEKNLIYKDKICLEIRSVDPHMIQLLYTHFLNNKVVSLGENSVVVKNLAIDNKTVFQDRIKIKTLSPITVYATSDDGHTTYFSPVEKSFYDAIVGNAKRKWCSYRGEEAEFDFSIYPTENTAYIKRATRFKDTLITAWHGEFYLSGNIEILNFLYQTGIGSKNSQGFGMFKII